MLQSKTTSAFIRDTKRMQRKHRDISKLKQVIQLILSDTSESQQILRQRHNAHRLTGEWSDTLECHVANEGDWLLIWQRDDHVAVFFRTGSHDELFRNS